MFDFIKNIIILLWIFFKSYWQFFIPLAITFIYWWYERKSNQSKLFSELINEYS